MDALDERLAKIGDGAAAPVSEVDPLDARLAKIGTNSFPYNPDASGPLDTATDFARGVGSGVLETLQGAGSEIGDWWDRTARHGTEAVEGIKEAWEAPPVDPITDTLNRGLSTGMGALGYAFSPLTAGVERAQEAQQARGTPKYGMDFSSPGNAMSDLLTNAAGVASIEPLTTELPKAQDWIEQNTPLDRTGARLITEGPMLYAAGRGVPRLGKTLRAGEGRVASALRRAPRPDPTFNRFSAEALADRAAAATEAATPHPVAQQWTNSALAEARAADAVRARAAAAQETVSPASVVDSAPVMDVSGPVKDVPPTTMPEWQKIADRKPQPVRPVEPPVEAPPESLPGWVEQQGPVEAPPPQPVKPSQGESMRNLLAREGENVRPEPIVGDVPPEPTPAQRMASPSTKRANAMQDGIASVTPPEIPPRTLRRAGFEDWQDAVRTQAYDPSDPRLATLSEGHLSRLEGGAQNLLTANENVYGDPLAPSKTGRGVETRPAVPSQRNLVPERGEFGGDPARTFETAPPDNPVGTREKPRPGYQEKRGLGVEFDETPRAAPEQTGVPAEPQPIEPIPDPAGKPRRLGGGMGRGRRGQRGEMAIPDPREAIKKGAEKAGDVLRETGEALDPLVTAAGKGARESDSFLRTGDMLIKGVDDKISQLLRGRSGKLRPDRKLAGIEQRQLDKLVAKKKKLERANAAHEDFVAGRGTPEDPAVTAERDRNRYDKKQIGRVKRDIDKSQGRLDDIKRDMGPKPVGDAAKPASLSRFWRGRRGQRGSTINLAAPITEGYEVFRKAWERTAEAGIEKAKATRVGGYLREKFQPQEALIGPEYEGAYNMHEGGKALGRARGFVNERTISKAVAEAPLEVRDQVYRWLGGEQDALPKGISKEAAADIQLVKDRIRETSVELNKRNILSDEALAEYESGWLRRVYEAHQANKGPMLRGGKRPRLGEVLTRMDRPGIEIRLPEDTVRAATNGLKTEYLKQEGKTTLVKFPDTPEGMRARQTLKDRLNLKKKDIKWEFDALPDQIREALGEVRSPAEAARISIQHNENRIATYDFLERLSEGKDAKGAWSEPRDPKAKRPQNNDPRTVNGVDQVYLDNKRLGPLSDRWVRADIADSVASRIELGRPQQISAITEGYRRALAGWKANRTILNPSTHGINVLSAPVMSTQAGVSIFNPANAKFYKEAARILLEADPYGAEYADLVRRRIVDVSLPQTELQSIRKAASSQRSWGGKKVVKGMETVGAGGLNLLPGYEQAVAKGGAAYAFYDNMIRVAKELQLKDRGMEVSARNTEINRYTPNYSRQGKFVQGLRMSPVGSPFATFAYEQKRILLNNIIHNPARAVATMATTKIMMEIIEAAFSGDVTDEEKDAIRQQLGGYGPFRREAVIGRDEKGRPKTLQIGALDPNDELRTGPDRRIHDDLVDLSSEQMDNAMYAMKLGGFQANPFLEFGMSALRQETRHGRPLHTTKEMGRYALEQMAHPLTAVPTVKDGEPTIVGLGSKARKVEAAFKGERPNRYAPLMTVGEALLDAFTHITLGQYDAKNEKKNLADSKGWRDTAIKRAYPLGSEGRKQGLKDSRADWKKKKTLGVAWPPQPQPITPAK